MTTLKVSAADIKTLNKFINEPNEFKRFILCQLWINNQYSQKLRTESGLMNIFNRRIKAAKTPLNATLIYDTFRDIKNELIASNENLSAVLIELKNQKSLMDVMNRLFELNVDTINWNINSEIDEIELTIKTNAEHIEKINSLSENQIEDIISNHETTNSN